MTHIILTIVLGLLSLNAISFLKTYVRLLMSGIQTTGLVVAYETSNFIITKNAAIPKIKFLTEQKLPVVGKPIHSCFIELSSYQLDKNYIAIYDKNDPNKFVIKSNIELTANLIIVTATLFSFAWLIVKFV